MSWYDACSVVSTMDMSAIAHFSYVLDVPFGSSAHNNDRTTTNLESLLPYPVEESRDNLSYFGTIQWFWGSRILVWTFLDVLLLMSMVL